MPKPCPSCLTILGTQRSTRQAPSLRGHGLKWEKEDPENVSHSCDRDYFSPYSLTAGSKLTRYLGAHHVGRDLQGWYYSIVWCYSIWSPQLSKAQQGEGLCSRSAAPKSKARFLFIIPHHPLVPWMTWSMSWLHKSHSPKTGEYTIGRKSNT